MRKYGAEQEKNCKKYSKQSGQGKNQEVAQTNGATGLREDLVAYCNTSSHALHVEGELEMFPSTEQLNTRPNGCGLRQTEEFPRA